MKHKSTQAQRRNQYNTMNEFKRQEAQWYSGPVLSRRRLAIIEKESQDWLDKVLENWGDF